MLNKKVGVFDSGVGGLSVVRAIDATMPGVEVVFRNDSEHVPYGNRSIDEIYEFTKPILEQLVADGCQVIVIACNTVTTNIITRLRQEISVPLVGMEPMVKPAAAASQTRIIAVCATERTLSSARYAWLKQEYAQGVTILEPDCTGWANMVENNEVDKEVLTKTINQVCEQGADQIVLGCTHYHWIEAIIRELAEGRAEVMQPEQPVLVQLRKVMARLESPNPA